MQPMYNRKSISIFQILPYFQLLLKIYKTQLAYNSRNWLTAAASKKKKLS